MTGLTTIQIKRVVSKAIPEADDVVAMRMDAGHDVAVAIVFHAARINEKQDARNAVRVKGDLEGAIAKLRAWAGERGYL